MRNYILLAVAILAGVLAFALTRLQLQREYARLSLNAEKVKILVAKHDLVAGDVINAEKDLDLKVVFANSLSGEEIRLEDVSRTHQQKLVTSKKKGSYFQWRDFELPTLGFAGSPLARMVRKSERALSVSVDMNSSVSGMIQPNDHVDIVGTFRFPGDDKSSTFDQVTLTILQNVTVLAVGQQVSSALQRAGAAGERPRNYATMTLAVTPKEAEMLVFAQQKGTLTFTLRNPVDPYVEKDLQNVNFIYLKSNFGKYTEERRERLERVFSVEPDLRKR